MRIRPLEDADVAAAAQVAVAALPEVRSSQGDPIAWPRRRIGHLARAHPDGAWVVEQDGAVRGVALAVVHDGIWGLSLMAVDPAHQARGTGSRLLAATLGHGPRARAGLIVSSEDPKAMRMYARAGFDLRPCVSVAGIADRAALPAGLAARPTEDFEAAADVSRTVRGGAYAPEDLAFLASSRPGFGALAVAGRGFAIHSAEGSPVVSARATRTPPPTCSGPASAPARAAPPSTPST